MLMHRDNAGMRGEGIFIGTSGWSYGHWKGPFYPAALSAGGFLPFYAWCLCTVLFQLPPRWRFDPGRLAAFLGALSPDFRYVFEFRDPSWFTREVRDELARHRAAFCIYELGGRHSPEA